MPSFAVFSAVKIDSLDQQSCFFSFYSLATFISEAFYLSRVSSIDTFTENQLVEEGAPVISVNIPSPNTISSVSEASFE